MDQAAALAALDQVRAYIAGQPAPSPSPSRTDVFNGMLPNDFVLQPMPNPPLPPKYGMTYISASQPDLEIGVWRSVIPLDISLLSDGCLQTVCKEGASDVNVMVCKGGPQDVRGKALTWQLDFTTSRFTDQRRGFAFFATSSDDNVTLPGVFSGTFEDYNPFGDGIGIFIGCDANNWKIRNFDARFADQKNPNRFLADELVIPRVGRPASGMGRIAIQVGAGSIGLTESAPASIVATGRLPLKVPLSDALLAALQAMGGPWGYHTDIDTPPGPDTRVWGNLIYSVQ